MIPEQSSQSVELNSYHCEINPSRRALFSAFVIPDQTTMSHQPGDGSFHHLTPGQDFESLDIVRSFDDLHLQLGAQGVNFLCERIPEVTSGEPHHLQPTEQSQALLEQCQGSLLFRHVGWCDFHSEQQTERVDEQMALASFDSFGGVVADFFTMAIGFDALTVEDRARGTGSLAFLPADLSTQDRVEGVPSSIFGPTSEDMINSLPWREIERKQPPWYAPFYDIEDSIHHLSAIGGGLPVFWVLERGFSRIFHCLSVRSVSTNAIFIAQKELR